MARLTQHLERRLLLIGFCLLVLLAMTGCSVFQGSSHLIEADPAVTPAAIASAEDPFVAQPFSLVAADSVGLAVFGFEIAMWADPPSDDALAQKH